MISPSFGLDVGGTKVLGVVIDERGGVVASHRRPTPAGAPALLAAMAEVVEQLASSVSADPGSVGIGAAGLVDRSGVLRYGPNLPSALELDVVAELGPLVGAPVAVDNDATCALVAELALGVARGRRDVVLVALGTGIGGGLVLDGEVRRGAHGFAGELGHMTVHPDGPSCMCGKRGCWEQFASGSALGRMAREAVSRGGLRGVLDRAGGDPEAVTGEHVGEAAQAGDAESIELIGRMGWWLGLGAANLVNICDPDLVVIGGGLVQLGELLIEPAREAFEEMVVGHGHREPVPILPATAGEHAAAVGAALLGRARAAG